LCNKMDQQKSSSVAFPPLWTPEVLKKEPEFGILKLLEGTWKNAKKTGHGLHTTCMPSPGSNSEQIPGKFHFVCEDYDEVLTFTNVGESVRNRGGTNEQFIGAMRYDTTINRAASPHGLLHVENGMYLWMKPIYLRPSTSDTIEEDLGTPEMSIGDGSKGPVFVPAQTICRSGTIPHGTTINMIGNISTKNGKTEWPGNPNDFAEFWRDTHDDGTWPKSGTDEHFAISRSMGGGGGPFNLDKPAPSNITDPLILLNDPSGNLAYTQRIVVHKLYPYSVRPDLRLRDVSKHQKIKHFTTFSLDTRIQSAAAQGTEGPQGGIINVPFVNKYASCTRCRFRMWIEVVEEDGHEFLQLQYEQISQFEFGFGTDGGVTVWPHIQINTLRKC